jgi:FkbM family methyltransferase
MTSIKKIKDFLFQYKRKSYALNKLDKKLRNYLSFNNGFFVEAGANDGIAQSNTLFFERYYGWTGLLIEAIPDLAKKCSRNRPNCLVENCALVSKDYPKEEININYCNLMSIINNDLIDVDNHILSGKRFLDQDEKTYNIQVPAKPLVDVLKKYNINHIDLLSLDVEGYECEVLKGMDFSRTPPKFILVEVRNYNSIMEIIGNYYYELAVLYKSNNFADILFKAYQQ